MTRDLNEIIRNIETTIAEGRRLTALGEQLAIRTHLLISELDNCIAAINNTKFDD